MILVFVIQALVPVPRFLVNVTREIDFADIFNPPVASVSLITLQVGWEGQITISSFRNALTGYHDDGVGP